MQPAREPQRNFLTDAQRSCINLGKTEPCVGKALQLLQRLRDQVQSSDLVRGRPDLPQERTSAVKVGASVTAGEDSCASRDDVLFIEGIATGSQRVSLSMGERESTVDWSAVIKKTLNLIVRMEEDRQNTLQKLAEEKEKVHQLSLRYDFERKRRLDTLESTVQAENECAAYGLKELHTAVEKEKIDLSTHLCDLSITEAKHAELKREEAELTHSSSLLKEKITDEQEKIRDIERQQLETFEEVDKAKHNKKQTERELLLYRKKVEAEAREMEKKLELQRRKLRRSREDLNSTEEENEMLVVKILHLEKDISESSRKAKEYEESAAKKTVEYEEIHSEVSMLQEEYDRLARKNEESEEYTVSLRTNWQKECDALEQVNAGHKAAVDKAQCHLQELKDRQEELEQEIDRIREEILDCKKQQEDDLKAVQRGEGELQRLQKQLDVSEAKFASLKKLNHDMSKRFEEESARTEDGKYRLKKTVENLQRKVKDIDNCTKQREVQDKDAKEKLKCLQLEVQALKEKLQSEEDCSLATEQELNEELEEWESAHSKKESTIQHLEGEIITIKERHEIAEREMDEVKDLERTSEKLQADLKEKKEKCEVLKANEARLEKGIEELDKRLSSMEKMKAEVHEENEELELTVDELNEKTSRGKEYESSLEKELKDALAFREEAQKRFVHYAEERQQYLTRLKGSLHSSLSHNASLREDYERLQGEYLALKSKVLGELQRQGDVKVATRDLEELGAVQAQLSSRLRTHLQYRASVFTNKLLSSQAYARGNQETLLHVHRELQLEAKPETND